MTETHVIDEVADELEHQLDAVVRAFEGRADGELRAHPAAEAWCAKEALGHLIDAETEAFGALLRGILDRDPPADWDVVPGERSGDCDEDGRVLLARWATLRRDSLPFVRSIRPEELGRSSERNWHRGPTETVEDLLRHWPEHTNEHLQQALATMSASGATQARGV